MTQKPLITIDKFSGMGQNGIIFCEGFYPEVDNGKSVMSEGYYQAVNFQASTSGFADLGSVYGAISLATIHNPEVAYNLYIDNNTFQGIYARSTGAEIKNGKIHTNSISNRTEYPDIIETAEGNILYPSERYIGRGVRGKATGGSTTTIVDTTKDFEALGYASGDKVTNLKTGIEYTITGVATNTLTFSASGSNTTAANDEYIAWDDNKYDTNITRQNWQTRTNKWVKQFKIYGDQYMFTNGNYLGMISADESTVDETYKQLPAKHQAVCMDINVDKVLVSADYSGKGALLLWDGASSGWNNFLEFDVPVDALTNYQNGWVFISLGSVYFTDGYQIQKIYSINNSRPGVGKTASLNPSSHNAMAIYGDRLFCANLVDDLNFVVPGVYVVNLSNPNDGFTVVRMEEGGRADAYPYSVFVSNIFSGVQSIQVGCINSVNYLYYGDSNTTYFDKSMIVMTSLPEPRRITGIGLNLSSYLKRYNYNNLETTRNVQVSVGDGNSPLVGNVSATGVTTTTATINGTNYTEIDVGDELYVRGDTLYGERTFVTSIANKGSASEEWTLSPALSSAVAGTVNLKILKLKKLDKINISSRKLREEVLFLSNNTGILSNKLFIEIVFYGQPIRPIALNINEIKVYGD